MDPRGKREACDFYRQGCLVGQTSNNSRPACTDARTKAREEERWRDCGRLSEAAAAFSGCRRLRAQLLALPGVRAGLRGWGKGSVAAARRRNGDGDPGE